jgi:hypothetical protein
MNEPIGSWGWLSAYDDTVWGPEWEFNQGTRVNTPTLMIGAMESLVTTGSQVTSLTSHPKDGTLRRAMSPIFSDHRESGHQFNVPSKRRHPTQGNVPNPCPGALGYFSRPEERVPPTGPPTPLPAASSLPYRDRPGPTLLSFKGNIVHWHSGVIQKH